MSTPTPSARYLRGALVGLCSGLVTTCAHVLAGAPVPGGGALVMLLLVCATVGAAVGHIAVERHRLHAAMVIAALCGGQLVGHLTLALAGGHHGHPLVTTPMLGMHALAALAFGVVISLAEYWHHVCASVLTWLRVFVPNQHRPNRRPELFTANSVVVQSVWLISGLGMRAPPQRCAP